MQRDGFISHAREDRAATAHPLAEALRRHGLNVSLEELARGGSLRRRVDDWLARAEWGVLVIGPGFLEMEWAGAEVDALVAREMGPERLMIPVWHRVTAADVARRSPLLAARLAVDAGAGIEAACEAILALIGRRPPATPAADEAQRPALPAIWRSLVENPGFSLADVHQHLSQRAVYAGQEIGGYTLRELIGVGASGAVFRAVHTRLGRRAALKLFFPFADDLRQVMQATERAVRGISSLRHRGIAALQEYGYVRIGIGAAPYLVYEPVDGPTLPEWSRGLEAARALSGAAERILLARLEVASAAAEALRVAYECRAAGGGAAGVPHGDLKPGNVRILADGQPVLMDFMMPGIQRLAAERLELWNGWEKDMGGSYQSGVPVSAAFGAGGYMAPEQEADGAATPAADIYALGRLFQDLFWPDTPGGRWAPRGAVREASAVTESEVAELVAAMTAPRPEARPASAADVLSRLKHIRAAHHARAGASTHA